MTVRVLSSRSVRLALCAAAVLTVWVAPAFAGRPEDKPKKQKPQQVAPTGAEDAATPSAADLAAEKALEAMTSQSTEGLEMVEHVDGTVSVDLEGRFMSVMLATPTADSGYALSCLTGHEAVEQARLATAGQAPKPAPKAPAVLEEK